MLRTLRLNRLGSLSRAFGSIPLAGRICGAVLIAAVIGASLAGFIAYRVADANGYDRGFEVGKTQGFDEGKDAGFKDGNAVGLKQSQAKYSEGYASGKSAGYDDGYNKATQEAIEAIKKYLPGMLQIAHNSGRASAPVYVPSFGFGSIHCTTYNYSDSNFGSIDCH